jgi:Xaa-Pro aminopeptidase
MPGKAGDRQGTLALMLFKRLKPTRPLHGYIEEAAFNWVAAILRPTGEGEMQMKEMAKVWIMITFLAGAMAAAANAQSTAYVVANDDVPGGGAAFNGAAIPSGAPASLMPIPWAPVSAGSYGRGGALAGTSDGATKLSSSTSSSPTVPLAELAQRREAALAKFHDGILLIHSGSGLKRWEDYGFRQDANFYYLTGMVNLHDAILALDGPGHESVLFVSPLPPLPMIAEWMKLFSGLNQFALPADASSASLTGISRVESWNGFSAWLDGRLKEQPTLSLYLDNAGQVGDFAGQSSNPSDLQPVANEHLLWSRAIQTRWPSAALKQAHPGLNGIRAVKSAYEQELLRRVALMTQPGISAAVRALRPGRMQRQAEGEVIAAMMDAGAEGPGFWPWVRSGSSAYLPGLFASFFDYHALDRVMAAGEIARVNPGAEYGMYKGDYGRTFPVSAKFTADQREVLDLFSRAYLAGLQMFGPGKRPADVVDASIGYIKEHRSALRSDLGRAAADVLVTPSPWSMYGHGIDMVEDVPPVFAAGNVICWAPEFSVQSQGFYVQDTVLLTAGGHELLNPPLPYEPQALEALKSSLSGAGPLKQP